MFEKVLVANRGEIAVRVIRACRELGVKTVAVFSEEDADGLPVRLADEARSLGGGGNQDTYLNTRKIIKIAKEMGAEAIHPGYGFLSERSDFADAVAKGGLTFIGPPGKSIDAMGSKTQARRLMEKSGVPLTPGSPALEDAQKAQEWAREIGYPVMLKAAYGGGGMGMIVVHDEKDLAKRFQQASDQAKAAFGNGEMFLEKFLERPRHVEIQILCDPDGNQVYVGERECSVQRRFQKLIEEAPSPALTPQTRKKMGEVSLTAAQAVGYVNAGTCEYIYQDGEFFFNEMNTRLQVEHPVTEMVYGVDLVEWQLRIASGEPLSIKQKDLKPRGWSIEARINAEDPYSDFMPTPGPVEEYYPPSGPGIRVDSHLYSGYTVPSSYDSLVAKLVSWGQDREQAIRRLARALGEYRLGGLVTNIPFHQEVLRNEQFRSGEYSTAFLRSSGIMDRMAEAKEHARQERNLRLAAALAALESHVGLERYIRLVAAAHTQRDGAPTASRWREQARREALRRWD